MEGLGIRAGADSDTAVTTSTRLDGATSGRKLRNWASPDDVTEHRAGALLTTQQHMH
jgi:hypothetical protein